LLDHEDVLARALADVTVDVQQDRLVEAGELGFVLGQHRVDVLADELALGESDVDVVALKARDLAADAVLERVGAEVRAPAPGNDEGLDRIVGREHTHLSLTDHDQGADVALVHCIRAQHLHAAFLDLLRGDLGLDQDQPARIEQAGYVIIETEDRRFTGSALVGADALESADAVVQRVGQDRGLSAVLPVEDFAVPPDLFAVIDHFAPARARALGLALLPKALGDETQYWH